MIYQRETSIDAVEDGDSVLQAILDLDRDLSGLFSAENATLRRSAAYIPIAEKGAPWGVCELDSSSLVPEDRLPVVPADKLPAGTVPPAGMVILWPSQAAPTGWQECDGSKLDTATYDDLFDVLGYAFGGSEDEGAFAVPSICGYFIRCMDHGAGRDPDSYYRTDRGDGEVGDVVGSIQGDENLSHTHNFTATTGTADYGAAQFYPLGSVNYGSISTTGGKQGHPVNIALMWIIKT